MIKQIAPKNTGEYANSWKIVKRGRNFIEIDTEMYDLFNWLENGTMPHIILPRDANALAIFTPSVDFAKEVRHPGTKPRPHIIHVVRELDRIISNVMYAQLKRHWKLFGHLQSNGMPRNSNITKTVGLTGTNVSKLRGRGKITLVRARTGRKQFKRRLGRRRRTGQFIKKTEMI